MLKHLRAIPLLCLGVVAVVPRAALATEPPPECAFCGVWALAQEPTVARHDVPDGHEALVQNALNTMRFEVAFAASGRACLLVERRGEVAVEAIGWELASELAGQWWLRNVPEGGEPTEMVIELNGPDQLLLRQPARMDEVLVFVRLGDAAGAQAWCDARIGEVTP